MTEVLLACLRHDIDSFKKYLKEEDLEKEYCISAMFIACIRNDTFLINLLLKNRGRYSSLMDKSFISSVPEVDDYCLIHSCLSSNYQDCIKYLSELADPNVFQKWKLLDIARVISKKMEQYIQEFILQTNFNELEIK
jgi:hypothetical protein